MARAIWTGSISFGLVNIPVSLYPAEKKSELSFNLLDRRDLSPVRYLRVNEATGEEVPWEEIVRGHRYDSDKYVVLTEDDFRRADVEASQTVEIMDFVAADEIDAVYYRTPYYLEPSKTGRRAYALLRETLKRTGRVGIAKVVIRTREHLGAVMVRGPVLVLNLLRFAHEVRDIAELNLPGEDQAELGAGPKQLEMAERLVEAMVTAWTPEKYRDEYRDELLALIEERIASGRTGLVEAPLPAPAAAAGGAEVIDIMSLLKRSVDRAEKSARRRAKRRAGTGAGGRGPTGAGGTGAGRTGAAGRRARGAGSA